MLASDLQYIHELIRDRSGIALDMHESLIHQRLLSLCRRHQVPSVDRLLQLLRTHAPADLFECFIEAFTNHETSFFRDTYPFELLASSVLPALLARTQDRRLHIWSCGCASGQEAYSIAMLLMEYLPVYEQARFRILASDICASMVEAARSGIYSAYQIKRGLTPRTRDEYFHAYGNRWRIDHRLARMIDFRVINALDPPDTLPKMDIVFLRNVLIYFSEEHRRRVLTDIHRILRPGGYLFLGASETGIDASSEFIRIFDGKTVCFKATHTPS